MWPIKPYLGISDYFRHSTKGEYLNAVKGLSPTRICTLKIAFTLCVTGQRNSDQESC